MKRITSILLIMTIILSCFALVGCDNIDPLSLEGYSCVNDDDWTLIRRITPNPNSNHKNGYSDNEYPLQHNLFYAIDVLKSDYNTFYLARISKNDYYFLCGYESYFHPDWIYSVFKDSYSPEIYDWYKVDKLENIENKINNSNLRYVYVVFDFLIEKDVINNIDLNYHYKYYLKLDVNSINGVSIGDLITQESVLLLESTDLIQTNNYPYYTWYDLGSDYWLHVDGNDKKYLSVKYIEYGIINEDMIPIALHQPGVLDDYPELYEHFEPLESLTYYYKGDYYHNSTHFTDFCLTYIGIDLEILKYVFENNLLGQGE